jgi:hypothetical protein
VKKHDKYLPLGDFDRAMRRCLKIAGLKDAHFQTVDLYGRHHIVTTDKSLKLLMEHTCAPKFPKPGAAIWN